MRLFRLVKPAGAMVRTFSAKTAAPASTAVHPSQQTAAMNQESAEIQAALETAERTRELRIAYTQLLAAPSGSTTLEAQERIPATCPRPR